MKKLQSNYTNPEQSKRLLYLGVPADSADCVYYVKDKCAPIEIIPPGNRDTPHTFSTFANGYNDVFYPENPSLFEWDNASVLPCWSVGRLIEIMQICSIPVTTWYIKSNSKQPVLEFLLNDLETSVVERNIDFSRLED